jgi:hypothetical protein
MLINRTIFGFLLGILTSIASLAYAGQETADSMQPRARSLQLQLTKCPTQQSFSFFSFFSIRHGAANNLECAASASPVVYSVPIVLGTGF